MRGAHIIANAWYIVIGIIPAYAGSTHQMNLALVTLRDHPRVCGEHPVMPLVTALPMGSSPRMRGALRSGVAGTRCAGIIPAYAGSTEDPIPFSHWARDHPRVCGEHRELAARCSTTSGSSPRMRGAHQEEREGASREGIIPAYAGSTRESSRPG